MWKEKSKANGEVKTNQTALEALETQTMKWLLQKRWDYSVPRLVTVLFAWPFTLPHPTSQAYACDNKAWKAVLYFSDKLAGCTQCLMVSGSSWLPWSACGPSSSMAEATWLLPFLCSSFAIFIRHKTPRPLAITHFKIQPTGSAILLALQWDVPSLPIQDEMGHLLLKKTFLFPAITWLLLRSPEF